MSREGQHLVDYRRAVEELLRVRYGLTVDDIYCKQITRAQEDEWTPEELVEWIGNHYDLDRLDGRS